MFDAICYYGYLEVVRIETGISDAQGEALGRLLNDSHEKADTLPKRAKDFLSHYLAFGKIRSLEGGNRKGLLLWRLRNPDAPQTEREKALRSEDTEFGDHVDVVADIGRRYRTPVLALRRAERSYWLGILTAIVAANATVGLGEVYLTSEEQEKVDPLGPGEFELILKAGHAALRAGDRVYNYYPGVTSPIAFDYEHWRSTFKDEGQTRFRFRVPVEQEKALVAFLKADAAGMNRRVGDCVSGTTAAIEENTEARCSLPGVDMSLIFTSLQIKLRKGFGGDSIVAIRHYLPEGYDNTLKDRFRSKIHYRIHGAVDSVYSGLLAVDLAIIMELTGLK